MCNSIKNADGKYVSCNFEFTIRSSLPFTLHETSTEQYSFENCSRHSIVVVIFSNWNFILFWPSPGSVIEYPYNILTIIFSVHLMTKFESFPPTPLFVSPHPPLAMFKCSETRMTHIFTLQANYSGWMDWVSLYFVLLNFHVCTVNSEGPMQMVVEHPFHLDIAKANVQIS